MAHICRVLFECQHLSVDSLLSSHYWPLGAILAEVYRQRDEATCLKSPSRVRIWPGVFRPNNGRTHHPRLPAGALAEAEGVGFGVSVHLLKASIDSLKELRP